MSLIFNEQKKSQLTRQGTNVEYLISHNNA